MRKVSERTEKIIATVYAAVFFIVILLFGHIATVVEESQLQLYAIGLCFGVCLHPLLDWIVQEVKKVIVR